MRGYDAEDPWSRQLAGEAPRLPERFTFALPEQLEFYGDAHAMHAFNEAVDRLEGLGGKPIRTDFSPYLRAAALLYEGPWVAERLAAIRSFFEQHADQVHPVIRKIIEGASDYSAADAFAGLTRIAAMKKATAQLWNRADVMVVPTAPTAYTVAEVLAEPFQTNRRLGYYTNFVNLLDLAAFAVPASMRPDGLPSGITFIAPAGSDLMLADLAQRFHQLTGLQLGALDETLPAAEPITIADHNVRVAVVGAHLSGLPLNYQLTERGGRLEKAARTSANYRLYALPGTTPPKPGMVRDPGLGRAIDVEVWRLPMHEYGSFVAGIPSPLGIGQIELDTGEWVQAFICEAWATRGAEEISHLGGWRAFLARKAAH